MGGVWFSGSEIPGSMVRPLLTCFIRHELLLLLLLLLYNHYRNPHPLPFLLLAGPSGSGKSLIVRDLANKLSTNFIEVRANMWSETVPLDFWFSAEHSKSVFPVSSFHWIHHTPQTIMAIHVKMFSSYHITESAAFRGALGCSFTFNLLGEFSADELCPSGCGHYQFNRNQNKECACAGSGSSTLCVITEKYTPAS